MERYFPIRPDKFIRGEKVFDFSANGKRIEGFYKPDTDCGDYPYQVLYTDPDATMPNGVKYTLDEANNPCIFESAENAIHWIISERNNELSNKHNEWAVAQARAAKGKRKRRAA